MPPAADLPGAPESRVHPDEASAWPTRTPAPPWSCRVEAVVWTARADAAALRGLAPGLLPDRGRVRVVGAVVRYLDSPVGPYEEVLGAVRTGPLTVHLPFLAVDSAASVRGGREHWALPKAYAVFSRPGPHQVRAAGHGWVVEAGSRAYGPRLPLVGLVRGVQRDGDGRPVTSGSRLRGSGRLARVDVRVGSDLAGQPGTLAGWLRSGRFPGIVLRGSLRVGR